MITTENRKQKTENRKMNLKSFLISHFLFLISSHSRGFILPFSMILAYVILIISAGVSDILTKEMYFSYIGRESQIAYYAADAGLDCALYIESAFFDPLSGIGIFPYDKTDGTWELGIISNSPYKDAPYSLSPSSLTTDIKCAGGYIFDSNVLKSGYTTTATNGSNPANGVKSSFMLRMDQGNGSYSCAKVSVEKSLIAGVLSRTIISRGYNTCNTNSPKFVERAIINTK